MKLYLSRFDELEERLNRRLIGGEGQYEPFVLGDYIGLLIMASAVLGMLAWGVLGPMILGGR